VYYVLGETEAGRQLFCVVIEFSGERGYPDGKRHDGKGEAALRRLEETMTPRIPATDSIQELATFWQHHDLTDFEDELEEVAGRAFQRAHVVGVPLSEAEHQAIRDAVGIGLFLPPIGVGLLMALRFANLSVGEHFTAYWPYVLALVVGLLLLILVPEITLFLPRQAGAVR
jgi:hypothetical protein